MIFKFRWDYENVNLNADLVQGREWRMCGVVTSFLLMTLSFALPKVNVFLQCKISFKIVKGVAGKILYSFLAHCIIGNILNSNINTQIIKEIFAFAVIHSFVIIFQWEVSRRVCWGLHCSDILTWALISGKNLSPLPEMLTLTTRVGTLIVATIYLQLIQNRYMFRSFTVLQCSHQHCVQPLASDVEVVGYL